jgi:acyl carrier protein
VSDGMNISSRTPEGVPNHCPICKHSIQIEPSMPFGDAPCPNCGSLLWFMDAGESLQFFKSDEAKLLRDHAVRVVADILEIDEDEVRNNPNIWQESGADSLDMVELVMDFESDFR